MYLTQSEYMAYGGETTDAAAYSRLEYGARKNVDRMTQKRVAAMAAVPEVVKRLMFELITIDAAAGITKGIVTPALSSFSTDGYSESYQETGAQEYVTQAENSLIIDYLATETDDNGVPLLYLGVDDETMR